MITYDPVRKMMVAMPPYGTLRPEVSKAWETKASETKVADAKVAEAKPAADEEEDFFDHLWDVANPLQHLPVIGTIYRAATGDKLDPVEKIAGGAIYGGLWGAVSSVASVAFEAITGKSVEDTVLALFNGKDDAPTAIARNEIKPAAIVAPALSLDRLGAAPNIELASAEPDSSQMLALTGALSAKGVDGDMAARALYAYRRSIGLTAPHTPVLASLN